MKAPSAATRAADSQSRLCAPNSRTALLHTRLGADQRAVPTSYFCARQLYVLHTKLLCCPLPDLIESPMWMRFRCGKFRGTCICGGRPSQRTLVRVGDMVHINIASHNMLPSYDLPPACLCKYIVLEGAFLGRTRNSNITGLAFQLSALPVRVVRCNTAPIRTPPPIQADG